MTTSGPAATATYLGYRTGAAVALALPELLTRPAAGLCGRILGLAMRGRRQMVGRHQRRVRGPELDGPGLERAVAETFASYGRYWLEAFRLPRQDLLALDGARFRSRAATSSTRPWPRGRGS